MDFRPLSEVERTQLLHALRGNAENDRAILMDRRGATRSVDVGFNRVKESSWLYP